MFKTSVIYSKKSFIFVFGLIRFNCLVFYSCLKIIKRTNFVSIDVDDLKLDQIQINALNN